MRRRVADLVQCLTVLVVYPQYATTEDTKCAKEKKNILKSGRVLARLSVLRVYVRLVVVNRNILLAADVLHARGMITCNDVVGSGLFRIARSRIRGEHG